MSLEVAAPPAEEPISVEEAKQHARVYIDDDDLYIAMLIKAARRHAEGKCNRAFARQQLVYTLDAFPGEGGGYFYRDVRRAGPGHPNWLPRPGAAPIELPRPPLVSVESITYLDRDGELESLDPSHYRVSTGTPGRLTPVVGRNWPVAMETVDAVEIAYTAGYDSTKLPEDARLAMLMLVAHWYDRREPVSAGSIAPVPMTIDDLLAIVDWRTGS